LFFFSDSSDIFITNSVIGSHATLVGKDTLVEHSHLQGTWDVGVGCLVSGVRAWVPPQILPDHTVFSLVSITHEGRPGTVLLKFGAHDPPHLDFRHPQATFFGLPWAKFFEVSGLTKEEIWPTIHPESDLGGEDAIESTEEEFGHGKSTSNGIRKRKQYIQQITLPNQPHSSDQEAEN